MGLEYCRQLARRGYDIIMVSNRQDQLDEAAPALSGESGVKVIPLFLDLADPGNEAFRIVIGELIGADAPGRIGTKELIEIDLFAAENAHHFRRNIQVSPLIIVHLVGTGQAVHAERRENKDLIRLEGEELIVHAHKFSTMQVNIQRDVSVRT